MAHLELSKAPVQELTPQEQKRASRWLTACGSNASSSPGSSGRRCTVLPLRKSGICNPRKRTNDGTGKIAGTRRRHQSITGTTGRV